MAVEPALLQEVESVFEAATSRAATPLDQPPPPVLDSHQQTDGDHGRIEVRATCEAFDRTVAYLKERTQFGVAIGSFQALQHRMARLFVEIELLKSAVAAALEALDNDAAEASQLASLAKARASDLSERALNEAAQLHGGIGVTDEFDLGLFLKRGRVLQQTFGDGAYHRRRYAALLGFAA